MEDSKHADRDVQFQHINDSVIAAHKQSNPAVSVDAKKKENIGNYKNHGREYSEKSKPVEVKGHDFVDKNLGKVVPYGIYDIGKNKGWVSVGISSDFWVWFDFESLSCKKFAILNKSILVLYFYKSINFRIIK